MFVEPSGRRRDTGTGQKPTLGISVDEQTGHASVVNDLKLGFPIYTLRQQDFLRTTAIILLKYGYSSRTLDTLMLTETEGYIVGESQGVQCRLSHVHLDNHGLVLQLIQVLPETATCTEPGCIGTENT